MKAGTKVECDICHIKVSARGIGAHKRLQHGIVVREIIKVIEVIEPIKDLSVQGKDLSLQVPDLSTQVKTKVKDLSTQVRDSSTHVEKHIFNHCYRCGRKFEVFVNHHYFTNWDKMVCDGCISNYYLDEREWNYWRSIGHNSISSGKYDKNGKRLESYPNFEKK